MANQNWDQQHFPAHNNGNRFILEDNAHLHSPNNYRRWQIIVCILQYEVRALLFSFQLFVFDIMYTIGTF